MDGKKSILLIDDDSLVLATLLRLLERAGYAVQAFQKTAAAIQASMMEEFDLVITDIRMPEIDGIQAIRYIREVRQKNNWQQAPEIFITGYAQDYEPSARALHPHAFIHKPFDSGEVREVVRKAFL
jgi:CheY-like chemotaxis protein